MTPEPGNVEAWLHAVRTSSYRAARKLLHDDQDVNVRGARGETALHVAARCCMLPAVTELLADGADANATDNGGRTPLQVAQELNFTSIVRSLVIHNEMLRALAVHLGREPAPMDITRMMQHDSMRTFREEVRVRVTMRSDEIVTAARHGDLKTVRRMVENGEITVNTVGSVRGETAFSAALGAGNRQVCEYLLANEAHVFAPCVIDGVSELPLTVAVMQGDVAFVRRLIEQGARTVSNFLGQTSPLAEAMKLGSIDMLDALLERGVGVSSTKRGVEMPWPAAQGVHFGSANPDDETPWWLLEMACWLQDSRLMHHLFAIFDTIASREMMARYGARALFLAVCRGSEDIVVELLDRGVSVSQSMNFNLTAMVAAVAIDSVSMLRLLIERGGDPNVVHSSIRYQTGSPQGLLATAIYANAMDCAYELLAMETRPRHLDRALALATNQCRFEYVSAHLDKALPSTIKALQMCGTSCPLVLDLLLSRCCTERFDISDLQDGFTEACRSLDADLVAVYLSHGMDVRCNENDQHESPFVRVLLQDRAMGAKIAKLLVENGFDEVYKVAFGGGLGQDDRRSLQRGDL